MGRYSHDNPNNPRSTFVKDYYRSKPDGVTSVVENRQNTNNGIIDDNTNKTDTNKEVSKYVKCYIEDFMKGALKTFGLESEEINELIEKFMDKLYSKGDGDFIIHQHDETEDEYFFKITSILTDLLPEGSNVQKIAKGIAKIIKDKNPSNNEDSKTNNDDTRKKYEILKQAANTLVSFSGNVIQKITGILPENFGIRKYFDGLSDSVEGLATMVVNPNVSGQVVGNWAKNMTELSGKILTGKFDEIDWLQAAKDSQISLILSCVNPVAGAVANAAVSGADFIMKATGNSKNEDNEIGIGDVLGVVQSSLGMVGKFKNILGNNIEEVAKISTTDAQQMQTVYKNLEEIENSTYRYEKFVKAEMFEDATKESNKLKEIATNFANKLNLKGSPTGFAENINENLSDSPMHYDESKPFELRIDNTDEINNKFKTNKQAFIENSQYSHTGFNNINNDLNKNYKDARDLMNISLENQDTLMNTSEYTVYNSQYRNYISKLTKQDMSDNCNTIIFNQDSSLSKSLSNSSAIKNKFKNWNGKDYSFTLTTNENPNLTRSIHGMTIFNPKFDNKGRIHAYVFDKYDYKWNELDEKLRPKTKILNNGAYILQEAKRIKNYYIIVPIIVDMN